MLEPTSGVNGKPLISVVMVLKTQPLTSLSSTPLGICQPMLPTSKGQFIAGRQVRLVRCIQRRRPPVLAQVKAIQNHLRLIVGLRPGRRGVYVQTLRPGVIGAELQLLA